MDYRSTLNLPKTRFKMRGNLAKREPNFLKQWDDTKLYERIIARNADKPPFVLHDGPPYANGNIHPGTVLNKVLKDIVVKYHNMNGHKTEYIPGWDCHGLPIEHNVEKDRKLGRGKTTDKAEVRRHCRTYALKFVDIQREEFKRLGVLGRWQEPYLTLNHGYESAITREVGAFVRSGAVYRGQKPVLWCHECRTALAEAEVEYEDKKSPSIYVKFAVGDALRAKLPALGDKPAFVVIWTTTPWTLPANLAICLHPEHEYSMVEADNGEVYLMATFLASVVAEEAGLGETKELGRFTGPDIAGTDAHHPFIDRTSKILLGEHVTLDAGTGCVHTAPGHGADDYEIGLANGLEIYAPVDAEGRFTAKVEHFAGQQVFEANDGVCQLLVDKGRLLHRSEITHSYPHCWRSKNPVIFRATKQWFISMDATKLRERALEATGKVQWIPKWGEDRFRGMLENRPDWCISRQRSWGVPIPAFYCESCGETLLDADVIDHVAEVFSKKGADSWFTAPIAEMMPNGTKCKACGAQQFRREEDILDVWFESGVSWSGAMEPVIGTDRQVDLYLEGSDQHRGWFQSSMLASVGTRDRAPFRAVLTHGFVVDGAGKKMSKSLGNYVKPEKVINQLGAEIFRLWVASEDYRGDIRLSDEIIKNLADGYRKLRNTCRFLLSNLDDFDPQTDRVGREAFTPIDRWAMHRLQEVIARVRKAYANYEFHIIYSTMLELAATDLSSFYMDILKDRLYASKADDPARRAAQTVFEEMLRAIVTLLAPITSFTAHEIWDHMPRREGDPDSVFLVDMPEPDESWLDPALAATWKALREVRSVASRELETARAAKTIGHSLEAAVELQVADDAPHRALIEEYAEQLAGIFIVSECTVAIVPADALPEAAREAGVHATVRQADGEKCGRCWIRATTVGDSAEHPEICARCADVLA